MMKMENTIRDHIKCYTQSRNSQMQSPELAWAVEGVKNTFKEKYWDHLRELDTIYGYMYENVMEKVLSYGR